MRSKQDITNLVAIGIVTKNRWHDLKITLQKIAEVGLESIPILIYDDGSDFPCPFSASSIPVKNLYLKRFDNSLGYIVRRNQLARAMHTKYYLSLDDDSYPVLGSLQAAVDFAETCNDLFCLSFPIYNPNLAEYQNRSLNSKPYSVRFFIGCGHLLHIDRFLQLEGYREELVHQGEEMEIAARAFQKAWFCYHYPDFQIHHNASNAGRNWQRMDFYGSRNLVLWNDWFVPKRLKLYKQGRTLLSRLLLSMQVRRITTLHGEISGVLNIHQHKKYRQEMAWNEYKNWQQLPTC